VADKNKVDEADRYASGTGRMDVGESKGDDVMPGTTGGGATYLPASGRSEARGTSASSAAATIGAVGEMDFTGAPAGSSGGSSAGETLGGGPGGGAISRGGAATRGGDAGPQSIESTASVPGDRELSTGTDTSGTGGSGGAGGIGGAGGSDIAGDSASTDR